MEYCNKRNSLGVLAITTGEVITAGFVSSFLIAHIFMFSGYDFVVVGLFSLFKFIATMVFYTTAAILCKRFKPILISRLGIIFMIAFTVAIIIWQDYVHTNYMLFGTLWGIGMGMFWGANNILFTKINKQNSTMKFIAWTYFFNILVKVIFPITFGLIIDAIDLWVVSLIVATIGIIQFGFSFLINVPCEENNRFRMIAFMKKVRENKAILPVTYLFFIQIFSKFIATLSIFTTVLIVLNYGTNTSIGIYRSVFAVVLMLVILLYNKVKRRHKIRFSGLL
ncbi:MAG: hypothetical protein FWE45_05095 [Firmicutes bacterium]|nr:hypothetical protein [Bacillota bacterium]